MLLAAVLVASAALTQAVTASCPRAAGSAAPLINGDIKSAVYGDFNGDGRIDVALDLGANQRIVALNRGGVFVPQPRENNIGIFQGPDIALRAVGDVNNDGHLDLIYRYYVSTWVALGRGDGTFEPVIASPAPTHNFFYGESRAIDLHHNGSIGFIDLDHLTGVVTLVQSNGDGTFRDAATYAWYRSNEATAITGGDFDGDGRLDAALTFFDGTRTRVTIGFNDGSAVLQQAQAIVDGQFTSFQPVDIDGDGAEELLGIADGVLAIVRSKGRLFSVETMRVAPAGTVTLRHPTAVDLNGDGILDVVFSSRSAAGILWGASQQRFSGLSYFELPGSLYGWNVATADIDGDGLPDLAGTGGPFGLDALFGSSLKAGRPNANRVINPGSPAEPLAFTDVDGDGIADIVARFGPSGSNGVAALLGDGHGAYPRSSKPYLLEPYKPWIVFAADFDGDGHIDIAITPPQSYDGTRKTSVVFGTVDGFGDAIVLDADFLAGSVFVGPSSPSAIVALKGTEIRLLTISSGRGVSLSTIGQLPSNSVLFTLSSDRSMPAQLVYVTRSDLHVLALKSAAWVETLTTSWSQTGGSANGASADINGDGRPDYVFCIDGRSTIYVSRPDGTFEPGKMDMSWPIGADWVTFADFDGEGTPDVIAVSYVSNQPSQIQIACYSGGRFAKCGGRAAIGSVSAPALVADIDGEGRSGVLVTSADGMELVSNVCATPRIRAVALQPSLVQGNSVTLIIHALATDQFPDGPITVREGTQVFMTTYLPNGAYDLSTTTWTSPPLSAGTHVFHVVYASQYAPESEAEVTVTVRAPEPRRRAARH